LKTQEQIQQEINKYIEAINKIIKEINPDVKISDKKIVGLLIIEYPEDHAETTNLIFTILGKICSSHTFELLAQVRAEQITRVIKDAS